VVGLLLEPPFTLNNELTLGEVRELGGIAAEGFVAIALTEALRGEEMTALDRYFGLMLYLLSDERKNANAVLIT